MSPTSQEVYYGDSASTDITPESNYLIAGVCDNGEYKAKSSPYVIDSVNAGHYVLVTFGQSGTINGETRGANTDNLTGTTSTLDGSSYVLSDDQGFYRIGVSTTGQHTLVASKAGYRNYTRTINVTDNTSAYTLNFKGDTGLVLNSCNVSYVLACVNKWKFPPEDPELALKLSKILAVVNAWKFPLEGQGLGMPGGGETALLGGATNLTRDLPGTPVTTNQTFQVTVSFTAPADDFNSIGLTEFAPAGWTVSTNTSACTPSVFNSKASGNKIEYAWDGPYDSSTNFTAVYNVTAPFGTPLGSYAFGSGTLEYYVADSGPTTDNVTGDTNVTVSGWLDGWSARRKLTFNTTNVTSNVTGFPVLVHLTTANFDFSGAKSQGADMRFVDSDNTTMLKYEIERWVDNTEAWVWVRVPQVDGSSSTDHIYLYYGNAAASDEQDVTGTWNDDFVFVTHMYDNPDSSHISDSTNSDNGTKKAAGEPSETSGKIGKAQSYDGTDDYVSIGTSTLTTGATTVSIWQNKTGTSNNAIVGMKIANRGTIFYYGASDNTQCAMFGFRQEHEAYTPGGSLAAGSWQHVTFVYDGGDVDSVSSYKIYINGVSQNMALRPWYIGGSTVTNYIGREEGSNYFTGLIDEVRISKIVRSADWTKASYLSESDSLATVGNKEEQ